MPSHPLAPSTVARLDARLAQEQADRRLPSVVAGVLRGGELVWSGAAGDLQDPTDTQYRIGSITKTFVAVCVMRLRDAGVLALDDRVDDHVGGTPIGSATIAQLLSHASGLQSETHGPWWERTPGGDWDALAGTFDASSARHAPGRRFHYSNVGYAVLGELLARHAGRPWDVVVRDELLTPLGMSRTTTDPVAPHATGYAVHPFADMRHHEPAHDAGAMAPAGQLWASLADLARWGAFLGGRLDGLLDPGTLAEMSRPVVVDDRPDEPWTTAHGLGLQIWNLGGRRFVGHGGSMPGFVALVRVAPDGGDGVVLAANSTAGPGRTFAGDLLDLLSDDPVPPEPWAPRPAPDLLELAGYWYWGPNPVELTVHGPDEIALAPASGAGRASRFRPDGAGGWVGLDGYYAGEPLQVVRDGDGRVRSLDLASFVFTRTPYDPAADVPGGVDEAGWH